MSGFAGVAGLVDAEVVDADEEEAVVGTELGAGGVEIDEVGIEGGVGVVGEAWGVVGFEQETLGFGGELAGEGLGSDGGDMATVGDEARAEEVIEGDAINAGSAGEEVAGGVHVGAGVGGGFEDGDGRGVAAFEVSLQAALKGDILGVGDQTGHEGERDVVEDQGIVHEGGLLERVPWLSV